MNDKQKARLLLSKKNTITHDELMKLLHEEGQTYEQLAEVVQELEATHILQMVKSQGRSTRTPHLAYRYRLYRDQLKQKEHAFLNQFSTGLNLDEYYQLPDSIFTQDRPYIQKVDDYMKRFGLPNEAAPEPERSAQLVGDEKWISEKGGMDILKRLQIWDKLLIVPVSDPLMMAVNAINLTKSRQYHLIVENKTTYQALISILPTTCFSTLIYGCGYKIVKSIEQFQYQLPGIDAEQFFFYFGDIDHSGISIWQSLTRRHQVELAKPLYDSCLQKPPFIGKHNQRREEGAVDAFVSELKTEHQLSKQLADGYYYPQEIVSAAELQKEWRIWSCKLMDGQK